MSGPLKGREAQTVASGQVALSAGLVLITIRVYHVQSELPRPNYRRTLVCRCCTSPKEGMSNSHPAQQAGGLVLNEAQTRFELIDRRSHVAAGNLALTSRSRKPPRRLTSFTAKANAARRAARITFCGGDSQ